jgi:hypothetical protein
MVIRNPNGTPYNVIGSLQQFDPENPEFDLLNLWDSEAIKQGGSPIFYYEVFIQANTVDPLYLEDRGKMWSPNPIQLWAIYDPVPSQNYMTTFGIDSPDEVMFEFNYKDALEAVGHPPKVGSRIYTPHRREHWEIIQRGDEQYHLWGQFRLQVMCRRFQESLTTGEGKVTQKTPDFSIDAIRGAGR